MQASICARLAEKKSKGEINKLERVRVILNFEASFSFHAQQTIIVQSSLFESMNRVFLSVFHLKRIRVLKVFLRWFIKACRENMTMIHHRTMVRLKETENK